MKYTITEDNIIIFSNGIINVPKDDLRYSFVKKEIEDKDYEKANYYLDLKNLLPKGYQVKEDQYYINKVEIPNNVVFNNKDQLEELKNHIFDYKKEDKDFSYLLDGSFLDLEGELFLKDLDTDMINLFRSKPKKEQIKLKDIIKKNVEFLNYIEYFSANEINQIINLDLDKNMCEYFLDFYKYYFKNKNSKFFKAIEKSKLSIPEWKRLLDYFNNEPMEYKTKLTNFKILLKKHDQSSKTFQNDYPIVFQKYRELYEKLDQQIHSGYYFELVKHRDEIVYLGQKFGNCLAGRSNSFISGTKMIMIIKKEGELFVTELSTYDNKIGDFETIKDENSYDLDDYKKEVQEIIHNLFA